MNPKLVKFHLPTTDQFSVAVDILRDSGSGRWLTLQFRWPAAVWLGGFFHGRQRLQKAPVMLVELPASSSQEGGARG
jgi:hypothetical protein